MYFTRPDESFISLLNTKYSSNRKQCRSRFFLISCLKSNTYNVSCRITSPNSSTLISQPSSIDRCSASLAFFGTFSMTSNPSCKKNTITITIEYDQRQYINSKNNGVPDPNSGKLKYNSFTNCPGEFQLAQAKKDTPGMHPSRNFWKMQTLKCHHFKYSITNILNLSLDKLMI